MRLLEIIVIAVGLSMDAFAVSICKGLSVRKVQLRHALITGLYFGGFQMAMPLCGYLLGARFQAFVANVDHWFTFVLLTLIGANMIYASVTAEPEEVSNSFHWKAMLPLALATSMDALAVGVTFAFLQVDIVQAVCCIGLTTFVLSCIGVSIGNLFGEKYKIYAERLGGAVLILMGFRILLEHLLG